MQVEAQLLKLGSAKAPGDQTHSLHVMIPAATQLQTPTPKIKYLLSQLRNKKVTFILDVMGRNSI